MFSVLLFFQRNIPPVSSLKKRSVLSNEGIRSSASKYFPFRADPIVKGGKMIMTDLLPLKMYQFILTFQVFLSLVVRAQSPLLLQQVSITVNS